MEIIEFGKDYMKILNNDLMNISNFDGHNLVYLQNVNKITYIAKDWQYVSLI